MSDAKDDETKTTEGIDDDQLPEDLQPGEDNPLAEPLQPGEELESPEGASGDDGAASR